MHNTVNTSSRLRVPAYIQAVIGTIHYLELENIKYMDFVWTIVWFFSYLLDCVHGCILNKYIYGITFVARN